MKDFRELQVWRKAHGLVLAIYRATRSFPAEERYGLVSQLRRAASSIPTNIAEGCGRGTNNELARFLQIAMGSASETEYHLLLAKDLGYLDDESYRALETSALDVKRMLVALHRKVESDKSLSACRTTRAST